MRTIGVFCGGFSSEWEISLKSAETICVNFPKEYQVLRIVVSQERWYVLHELQEYDFDINTMSFNFKGQKSSIDTAIVYVHGDPGENGKIQALLDMKGIPYLNSGPLASGLSFDKWHCNQFLKGFGIKVANSVFLSKDDQLDAKDLVIKLGLPIFVKPSDSGSSYGISKVKTTEEVLPAFQKAFGEGDTVVAESFLDGVEVTCGVFRRKDGVYALPLTEIASENEFFDYDAKYLGKSSEITPARVDDVVRNEVQRQAKYIYQLLRLRSIARIDFMIVNGVPHVIEVNTTPGFSPASIVPQMLACDGITIQDFWKEILEVGLKIS